MKRLYAVILVVLSLLCCLFASCISREAAERSAPADLYHTVTFYDGDAVVQQLSVRDGAAMEGYPQGDAWRDEQGLTADLATLAVTADMRFYKVQPVTLRTTHVRYMAGSNGLFRPDDYVTRGETAQIVRALLSEEMNPVGGMSFTDVPESSEYYPAVQAASALGVMTGYADGTFRPDEPVTRSELLTVLCRLRGVDPVQALAFEDVPAEHWAMESVAAAMTQGWVNGYEDGGFYPDYPATRAETVVLVNRALGRTPNKTAIDTAYERSPYQDVSRHYWAYYDIIDVSVSGELLAYIMGEVEDAKPGFVLIGEDLCHVNEELRLDLFAKGFHTIQDGLETDGLYYVEEDGYFIQRNPEGLKELDGSMFYVGRQDGPFETDYTLEYLYFGANGRYTTGDEELDGLVNGIMNDIIQGKTENLCNEEKLREAFNYIAFGNFDYMSRPEGWSRGSTDWVNYAGKIMLAERRGSCFFWAAAFLQLARRLGFQAYPVCGGVFENNGLHAWVMIDDEDGKEYIYDVELDWAFRTGAHGRTYRRSGMDMFKWLRGKRGVTYIFPGDTYSVPPRDDVDIFGDSDTANVIWPNEVGGSAYMQVGNERILMATTWSPIYDASGDISGYTITAVYEGKTYTYEFMLTEVTEPTPPIWEGEPGPDASPDPGTNASPEPGTDASPEPGTDASPGPGTDASPNPGTDASPNPGTDASPNPGTDASPEPGTSATTDPGTSATTAPDTSATTAPETSATTAPSTTTAPEADE